MKYLNYRRFVKCAVSGLTEEIRSRKEGAKIADDPEDVHQLRVASRRLCAAFSVFKDAFCKKDLKEWKKGIGCCADALGAARDYDMQILFLETLRRSPQRAGIKELAEFLKQQRAQEQVAVIKALKRLEKDTVLEKIEDALHSLPLYLKKVKKRVFFKQAEKRIFRNVRGLLEFEAYVECPDDVEHLHAMRIAAKRLRYRLELYNPFFGERLCSFIEAAGRVQRTLGKVHDLDVWTGEILPVFLSNKKKRQKHGLRRGICSKRMCRAAPEKV